MDGRCSQGTPIQGGKAQLGRRWRYGTQVYVYTVYTVYTVYIYLFIILWLIKHGGPSKKHVFSVLIHGLKWSFSPDLCWIPGDFVDPLSGSTPPRSAGNVSWEIHGKQVLMEVYSWENHWRWKNFHCHVRVPEGRWWMIIPPKLVVFCMFFLLFSDCLQTGTWTMTIAQYPYNREHTLASTRYQSVSCMLKVADVHFVVLRPMF